MVINQSSTGGDIQGTSSTWTISKAGAAVLTAIAMADNQLITLGTGSDATIGWNGSVLNIAGVTDFDDNVTLAASATITQAGVAGSTVHTITAGDMVMSDGSLAITDADVAATFSVTSTGNLLDATTGGVVTIVADSVTTGRVIDVNADAVTTGTLLHLDTTAATFSGNYIACFDGAANDFTVGLYGATTIAGNAAGTNALTLTAGDIAVTSGDVALAAGKLSITEDADGIALTIVADATTTGNVVDINADAVTSGTLLHLDTTAATFSGKYIQCYDGAADDFSVGLYGATIIAGNAAGTDALTLTAGDVTVTSGDITVTAGNMSITEDADGIALTIIADATTTGNVVDINADAVTSGTLLHLDTTAATFSGKYIDCYDGAASDFSVGLYGATVIAGNATGTDALTLTNGDITVSSGDVTLTSGALVLTSGNGTLTAGNLTLTAGNLVMSDGNASITETADSSALTIVADAATAGNVVDINADGVTSGVLLHLDTSSAGFSGKYIECYDGAAADFSVGANGATTIAGSAALTAALTLTAGDLVMSDGVLRAAVTAGATADVGSVQGGGAVTRSIVEVATVGTTGDAVTLPTAVAGQIVYVVNHGANAADVFPAASDAINEGSANAAKAVAANATLICLAYDATNWECLTLAR